MEVMKHIKAIPDICAESNIQGGLEEDTNIRNSKTLIKNIYNEIERKIMEHGIIGSNLERCGWYTLACEEYGKRDGLQQANEIIRKIMEEEIGETIL